MWSEAPEDRPPRDATRTNAAPPRFKRPSRPRRAGAGEREENQPRLMELAPLRDGERRKTRLPPAEMRRRGRASQLLLAALAHELGAAAREISAREQRSAGLARSWAAPRAHWQSRRPRGSSGRERSASSAADRGQVATQRVLRRAGARRVRGHGPRGHRALALRHGYYPVAVLQLSRRTEQTRLARGRAARVRRPRPPPRLFCPRRRFGRDGASARLADGLFNLVDPCSPARRVARDLGATCSGSPSW